MTKRAIQDSTRVRTTRRPSSYKLSYRPSILPVSSTADYYAHTFVIIVQLQTLVAKNMSAYASRFLKWSIHHFHLVTLSVSGKFDYLSH